MSPSFLLVSIFFQVFHHEALYFLGVLLFWYSTLQFLSWIFLSCQPIIFQSSWNIFLFSVLSPNIISFTNWIVLLSSPSSRSLTELLNSSPPSWHVLFHSALFMAMFPAHLLTFYVRTVGMVHVILDLTSLSTVYKPQLLACTCCKISASGPAEDRGDSQSIWGCL